MKCLYKDEDSRAIYEYLKEFDKETERRKEFSSALKRQLVEKHYREEELKRVKKELEFYKSYYESKEYGRDE